MLYFLHEFLSSGYSFLGTAKEHCKNLVFSPPKSTSSEIKSLHSFLSDTLNQLRVHLFWALLTHAPISFFHRTTDPRYGLWYLFQSWLQSAVKDGKILPNSYILAFCGHKAISINSCVTATHDVSYGATWKMRPPQVTSQNYTFPGHCLHCHNLHSFLLDPYLGISHCYSAFRNFL